MDGKVALKSLGLKDILSFGSDPQEIELEPLNVLIGPNGSGKSNVITILGLLRSLPRDMSVAIREGGGIREWMWKGVDDPSARIHTAWERDQGRVPLFHSIGLATPLTGEYRHRIVSEEVFEPESNPAPPKIHYRCFDESVGQLSIPTPVFYKYGSGSKSPDDVGGGPTKRYPINFKRDQSVLAQFRDPESYPELAFLSDRFEDIRLFRKWTFGPDSPLRSPQKADLPSDFLLEDGSNLGVVVNSLTTDPRTRPHFLGSLQKLYQGVTDIRVRIVSGYVEANIEEDNTRMIPAVRLSDGTLRFLCLLSVLCHPSPPSLICIEEPELGLHPDLMASLAELLIESSTRTQLIVTTHSGDLVSALGDVPETVVVCERGIEGTTLKRLEPKKMEKWLERYSIGSLWASGEIGGNRW